MKKKLLSNKGFTLVECLVAIVIFSIMALMVSMMYSMSIQTYKFSRDIDTDVAAQEGEIAIAQRYDTDSGFTPETNTLDFNFNGKNIAFQYEARKTSSATDDASVFLNYIVAEGIVDHVDSESRDPSLPNAPKIKNGTVKIYGSVGIKYIPISNFERTNEVKQVNTTVGAKEIRKYVITLDRVDDITDVDGVEYRSIKLAFTSKVYDVESSSTGLVEAIAIGDKTIRIAGLTTDTTQWNRPTVRDKLDGVNGKIIFWTADNIADGFDGFKAYFGVPYEEKEGKLYYQTVLDDEEKEVPGVYSYLPNPTK